jgi:hypothetical protein
MVEWRPSTLQYGGDFLGVHADALIVIDYAGCMELIKKEADTGSRRADHGGQGGLAHSRQGLFSAARLARQHHQDAEETQFAGAEYLVGENSSNCRFRRKSWHINFSHISGEFRRA